jgi:hypothetical protein
MKFLLFFSLLFPMSLNAQSGPPRAQNLLRIYDLVRSEPDVRLELQPVAEREVWQLEVCAETARGRDTCYETGIGLSKEELLLRLRYIRLDASSGRIALGNREAISEGDQSFRAGLGCGAGGLPVMLAALLMYRGSIPASAYIARGLFLTSFAMACVSGASHLKNEFSFGWLEGFDREDNRLRLLYEAAAEIGNAIERDLRSEEIFSLSWEGRDLTTLFAILYSMELRGAPSNP